MIPNDTYDPPLKSRYTPRPRVPAEFAHNNQPAQLTPSAQAATR